MIRRQKMMRQMTRWQISTREKYRENSDTLMKPHVIEEAMIFDMVFFQKMHQSLSSLVGYTRGGGRGERGRRGRGKRKENIKIWSMEIKSHGGCERIHDRFSSYIPSGHVSNSFP